MIPNLRLRMMIAVGTLAIAAIVAVALTARQRTHAEFRRFQALTKVAASANAQDGQTGRVAAFLEKRCCDPASLDAAAVALSPRDVVVLVNSADRVLAKFGKPLESVSDFRFSRAGDKVTLHLVPRPDGRSASKVTLVIHMEGTTIRTPSGETASLYLFPLPDGDIEQPERIFLGSVDRSLLLATVLIATVALVATWTVTRRIAEPVEELRRAARELARGDLTRRVDIRGSDEIAELGRSFNAMASELENQQQLRRNLVHDVVHELRTPLTALRCRLDSISDGVCDDPHNEIQGADEEIGHLTRLVEDLHEVALAEARELRFDISQEPLAPIIASAVRAAGLEGDSRLRIVVSDCAVRGDPVRLRQVMLNLLTNAARHTPSDGSVTVSASPGDGEVIVEVQNTGSHLNNHEIAHVFDRFYRADPSRERSTGGTGLGLAIVKNIVEAHDGRVWARNDGVGVSFGFALPMDRREVNVQ